MMHRDMLLRQQVCVGRHPAFKLACSARTVVTSNHSSKYTVTYVNRSVHAEEHIEAPGSVVVRGDVAPNASIEATGDVMVWGRYAPQRALFPLTSLNHCRRYPPGPPSHNNTATPCVCHMPSALVC